MKNTSLIDFASNLFSPDDLDWCKQGGLLPAIVQDAVTGRVLMLAYMNKQALAKTLSTGEVHFFSRSRRSLWKKGETSGNVLKLASVAADCDADTLLVRALPAGPVCHTGSADCFGLQAGVHGRGGMHESFLPALEGIVAERSAGRADGSYTAGLLAKGLPQVARKVGEEGLEVALAAVTEDDEALIGEAADLLYHLIVLLRSRQLSLRDVDLCLRARHQSRTAGAAAS